MLLKVAAMSSPSLELNSQLWEGHLYCSSPIFRVEVSPGIICNCSRYINFLKDVASPLHQHSSGTIPSSSCSQLLCSIRGIAINHDHAGSLAREVSGACEMPPPLFSIPINTRCYCFEIYLYQLLLASSK